MPVELSPVSVVVTVQQAEPPDSEPNISPQLLIRQRLSLLCMALMLEALVAHQVGPEEKTVSAVAVVVPVETPQQPQQPAEPEATQPTTHGPLVPSTLAEAELLEHQVAVPVVLELPVTVAVAVVHLSQRQASTVEQAAPVVPPAEAVAVAVVPTVVSTVATVATVDAPKSNCGCTDDRKHFPSRRF